MRYHIDNRTSGSSVQLALTAGLRTQLSMFNGSAGVSPGGRIASLAVGLDGSPNASTDTQIVFIVQRLTADGTATTIAANTLKNPWVAVTARNTVKANYSVEGTYSPNSNVWLRTVNQRASMQWNMQDVDAPPEWQSIQPNTPGNVPNGVGILASGGAAPVTSNASASCEFDE